MTCCIYFTKFTSVSWHVFVNLLPEFTRSLHDDLLQTGQDCQSSFLLTTSFSQNFTEPSKGISYPVGDLCRRFTKLTGPFAYTLHSNLVVNRWYKCIHFTKFPSVSQHVFGILLWRIKMYYVSGCYQLRAGRGDKLHVINLRGDNCQTYWKFINGNGQATKSILIIKLTLPYCLLSYIYYIVVR